MTKNDMDRVLRECFTAEATETLALRTKRLIAKRKLIEMERYHAKHR